MKIHEFTPKMGRGLKIILFLKPEKNFGKLFKIHDWRYLKIQRVAPRLHYQNGNGLKSIVFETQENFWKPLKFGDSKVPKIQKIAWEICLVSMISDFENHFEGP